MYFEVNISKKQFNELIDEFIEEQQDIHELEKLIRKLLTNYSEWVNHDMEKLLKPFLKKSPHAS
jgi:Mg2+ and Co2+ transporter CorA